MSQETNISNITKFNKREDIEHMARIDRVKMGDGSASAVIQQLEAIKQGSVTGIGCTKMLDATPTFNKADCELEIRHENINAGIILGRDRPGDKLSGYGGSGTKRSSAIDIVVGRLGPEAATVNSQNEIIYCENNFIMDSARIYISQRSNIDQNFRIKRVNPSEISPSVNSSAIGIKADCLRLIGRSDIKIVTGTDMYDSHGRKIGTELPIKQKICLIGNNSPETLQPMVKGENLKEFLVELMEAINSVADTMASFILYQNTINLSVINHTHRDKLNVSRMGFPAENLLFAGYGPALKLTTEVKSSLVQINSLLEALKLRFLEIPDNTFSEINENILSQYNFCN